MLDVADIAAALRGDLRHHAIVRQYDGRMAFLKCRYNADSSFVASALQDHRILAGCADTFTTQKQRDDLRRLSQGLKGISVLTYDELSSRLGNYLQVVKSYSETKARKKAVSKTTQKKTRRTR